VVRLEVTLINSRSNELDPQFNTTDKLSSRVVLGSP
jgi:hypothetical protein